MNRGRPKTYDWCTKDGCHREHYARGMCQPHYRQAMRVLHIGTGRSNKCSVPGCSTGIFRNGKHCLAHTLEREYLERGRDESMLPKEGS